MKKDLSDITGKKTGFFRRIYLKWKFEWRYLPRDIKLGFKNLITWFPIIWKDRDWDHEYFYLLMKKKLTLMSLYHLEKSDFYVGALENVRWMNVCIDLIDLIIDGHYSREYMDYREKKNSFRDYEKGGELIGYEQLSEILSENFEDYFKKHPREYKQALEEIKTNKLSFDTTKPENKEYIALLMAHRVELKARALLFKILNTHLPSWWV